MLLERRVEIHDLLDRHVEAGEQHVAHDQDGQRVVPVLEPFDEPVLLLLAQMPARQPLLVVVARRHDDGRLGTVQPIQRFLVGDRGVAARGDHLGLEAVRRDEAGEVIDEVQADRLDAARRAGDRLLGGEAPLDGGPLVVGAAGEDAVEDLIDGLPDDLQLREPALVEDRHRRPVLDRLLDGVGVDVRAERLERAPVLLVYGGAGETEEAGVRQRLAHVRREALVLRAVGFIHHDEDVGGLGQRRVDRRPARGATGAGDFLELLNRGHHRLAGRMLEDLPQAAHAVRPLGVREPARGEHAGNLPVELRAVGDDDDGGLLLRRIAAELERQPEHGQALPRPLRVPDDPAPRARLPRRADPPQSLVHGDELLVAGQLADGPAAVDLEHDEVAHDVEEVARLEESVEQDVLRRRYPSELLAELFRAQGIRLLPFEEEPLRGADRAVDGALAAGADEDLRRLEEPRRPLVLPTRVGLLVAAELLHRLRLPRVADGGALALDDGERQAVDEHDDVGNDVLLRSEHPVLPGDDPLVAIRPVKVEEPDRVAPPSVAAVLLQRDAVGERRVECLVGLRETGRGHLRDGLHGLRDVGLGEPGVQPLEGGREVGDEDGLLEARAFALEVFGRDVGVAASLQELDRGILRKVTLVPPAGLRSHAAS